MVKSSIDAVQRTQAAAMHSETLMKQKAQYI